MGEISIENKMLSNIEDMTDDSLSWNLNTPKRYSVMSGLCLLLLDRGIIVIVKISIGTGTEYNHYFLLYGTGASDSP